MDSTDQLSAALRTELYFQRFGFCGPQIAVAPASDLALVVVVPCHNEPDLTGALEALRRCDPPENTVEIIVVINGAANDPAEVHRRNERSLAEARAWAASFSDPRFQVHLLSFPELPPKQAGVGLARKIGMDEAVRRFVIARQPGGIIAGFDADCRCAPNYLRELELHFREHPESPGCAVYFEHPLEGELPATLYEGVAEYELHLRYYVQALRYAEYPHAYHTVGSSMAVRMDAYVKQGGMNRRQAGEDFYFLHKIIPLGGFTELSRTTVYPSPRASERVPFGTGRAMRDRLLGEPIRTYPFEAFQALRNLFQRVPEFNRGAYADLPMLIRAQPEPVRSFLHQQRFEAALEEIRANTTTEAAFRKRFYRWFDGFQTMKCLNYARDQVYGKRPVASEAQKLLAAIASPERNPPALPASPGGKNEMSVRELLQIYRRLDREGTL